jgi:hypothetical protein
MTLIGDMIDLGYVESAGRRSDNGPKIWRIRADT